MAAKWTGILFAVALAGCAEDTGAGRGGSNGPAGGKADQVDEDEGDGEDGGLGEAQEAHLNAVGKCEVFADRDRDHIGEARIEMRSEIETTRIECLREANDATRDEIESTLVESESTLSGESEDAFTVWRETAEDLCGLLTAGSADAKNKGSAVTELACLGQAELLLAEAIAAFADLGGTPANPPEARETYAGCYDEFDDTLEEEQSPSLELRIDANEDLAGCLREETDDLAELLAGRIVDAFPGRERPELEALIGRELDGTDQAAEAVCNVLGSASIAAGDPEAELEAKNCVVAASIWRAELFGYTVPALTPE